MKKIYALIIVLVILSVATICAVASTVNAERNQVTITEYVLYGDKSVADGLKIENKNHYDYKLYWETSYTVGEEPICETDYSFYATGKHENITPSYEGVFINDGIEWGFNKDKPVSKMTGIQNAYKELYDSAEYDVEITKKVYIKDYYDYYPISLSFDLPNTYYVDDGGYYEKGEPYDAKYVSDIFRDYFKIPILESDTSEIHITKYSDGSYSSGSDSNNVFNMNSKSVIQTSKNRCFFTINNCKDIDNGEYVDTSLIPGGYGIYSFYYFKGDSSSNTGIMADTLETVYSLDKEANVRHLGLSADETKLLLFIYEGESSYLTVIDIETMKEMQKILINDSFIYSVYEYDDFIVADTDGEFSVISFEDNKYNLKFTVPTANFENEKFQDLWNVDCMDFKDGKLAVVGSTFTANEGYESCGFFVAVYDKSGLIYYGEYDNSLDANTKYGDYNTNCHPNDISPNKIKWS